ncbi:MAG: translation initiation factor IF-2 [Deltaproteobacteria bacterium]
MRVYEIAKEVGIPNKDLITKIRALGLEVNNHMSSLDADDVARIKRSLEKEKGTAAPAEKQKLSSGTVLRRRSSGDKASDDDAPSPSTTRHAATPPAAAAPAPVIRRRVDPAPAPEVEAPTRASAPSRAEARAEAPAPAPVKAPVVHVEPKVEAPQERPKAAPVAQAPSRPTPVPAVASPPPAPAPVAAAPVKIERPAPADESSLPRRGSAAEGQRGVVERPAPPPVVTPKPPAPAAVAAAAPETPVVPSRSRVIVAGPQVVARTSAEAGSTHGGQRIVDVQPPPSTPLPPRITPVRPAAGTAPQQHAGPSAAAEPRAPVDARSQFERDLERARARTADKPSTRSVEVDMTVPRSNGSNGEETQSVSAPRDPSRPAVGSVIALPPRIKITERTPISGRPAPGPQPPNPIRGRFAQQQQRGGRPGGPHGGHGRHDMKKLPLGKKGKQTTITTPAEHKRVVRIEDTISVSELARSMGIKAPEVLKKLWGMGMTGVNINASIDFDTAQLLSSEFGYEVQNVAFKEEEAFTQKSDDVGESVSRAPVVTIMGHVDHGKTTLLDAIRKTRVAAGEAGGITQHVAAYKVAVPGHGDIVFLDTPGHEAFTEMRARGAQATDIVVLVVAANDGVMPQTIEALNHAKDAKVKIIVAVNKIDMPDAAPERIKQQLAEQQLIAEDWGGDTIYVNVSAIKGENIDKLLESIAVTAEVMELRADPKKPASGLVIEARLDRNRGPMATVLIQEGTLRAGDIVVAGRTYGKVRAMLDDRGNTIEEAGPSTPIELLGLDGVPDAGDQVNAAEDDKVAKQVVEHRRQSFRKRELASTGRVSLESLMERISEGIDQKELKIVLKADVQGSAEALKAALVKLTTEKVKVTVIGVGVGGITESDVNLAKAGNAIIVGFHVRPAGKSSKLAEQEEVEIRLYDIIYDALDDVKSAMAGLLAPIKREIPMGSLSVRETFAIPKMGVVAGCMVTNGKINRKAHLRIVRDAVQVYEGKIGSLRRFKDDVSEVTNGFECGVMVAGWNEIKVGDVIEAYEVVEEAAKL